jgi:hypothetical protein
MTKQYTPPNAITIHTGNYHMSLVGEDAQLMVRIVNMGIDAWLTAITSSTFVRGDNGYRLNCIVSPNDLTVILRRLSEIANSDDTDNETASDLLSDIMSTFDDNEQLYAMIRANGQLSYLSERFFVPFEHKEV